MPGKFMLTAAAALMLTAAWAAGPGAPAAKSPADKLAAAEEKPAVPPTGKDAGTAKPEAKKISPEEEREQIRQLEAERIQLLRKIQNKRMELLKNNPKLRKMYLEIIRQTQELAIELDSDLDIRSLNRELREVETQLKAKRK